MTNEISRLSARDHYNGMETHTTYIIDFNNGGFISGDLESIAESIIGEVHNIEFDTSGNKSIVLRYESGKDLNSILIERSLTEEEYKKLMQYLKNPQI